MAVTAGSLADGQLPAAKGTLYTVPASKAAIAVQVILVPTSAARTVNLYVKRAGSSSRRVIGKDLSLDPASSASLSVTLVGLSTGDIIEGDASAATEVDYTIMGDLV